MEKDQMTKWRLVLASLLICAASAQAAVIPLGLNPADFNTLGTWESVAGWSAGTTTMTGSNLSADVTYQVFQDSGTGGYAYLYQVENTGLDQSWEIVEGLTLSAFFGADANTTVGYLTANQPSAFQAGTPFPDGVSVNPLSGPTISFLFPGYIDAIEVGEASRVLYVLGDFGPTMITGNLINGHVASGSVAGPVPEPATMGLLAMGALALIRRRNRK